MLLRPSLRQLSASSGWQPSRCCPLSAGARHDPLSLGACCDWQRRQRNQNAHAANCGGDGRIAAGRRVARMQKPREDDSKQANGQHQRAPQQSKNSKASDVRAAGRPCYHPSAGSSDAGADQVGPRCLAWLDLHRMHHARESAANRTRLGWRRDKGCAVEKRAGDKHPESNIEHSMIPLRSLRPSCQVAI